MIVEVATHGSAIRRKKDQFLIEIKTGGSEKQVTEIPAEKVDAILVTANAMLSTQAVRLCMEKQIQIVLASPGGWPYARMWASTPGRATELRRNQYINSDTVVASEIAIEIVVGKLKGQRQVLRNLKNNRNKSGNEELLQRLEDAMHSIGQTKKKVAELDPNCKGIKQTLLGLEGSSAAIYFPAVSLCLPLKWQFARRSQNPGLDPFNSSLNYMYGIGYTAVEKTIILSGLDPNAGFYHADSYGKPTLVFDIMELCRPLIDKTLISLFNKKIMKDDWFEMEREGDDTSGVRIAKPGRRALLAAYMEDSSKPVERISWNFCRDLIGRLSADNQEDKKS